MSVSNSNNPHSPRFYLQSRWRASCELVADGASTDERDSSRTPSMIADGLTVFLECAEDSSSIGMQAIEAIVTFFIKRGLLRLLGDWSVASSEYQTMTKGEQTRHTGVTTWSNNRSCRNACQGLVQFIAEVEQVYIDLKHITLLRKAWDFVLPREDV